MTLGVREGRIRFEAVGSEVEAGAQPLISCAARTLHTVEALEESACLLTISVRDALP